MKALLALEEAARWGTASSRRRDGLRIAVALIVVAAAMLAAGAPRADASDADLAVIVQGGDPARDAVIALGGSVDTQLAVIEGFTASIPSSRLEALRTQPGVVAVTRDSTVELLDWNDEFAAHDQRFSYWGDEEEDDASLTHVTKVTGARVFWDRGFTGSGVDVAVIDTGVAPVAGLDRSGGVVNGLDASFDSQTSSLYVDRYGHGTHMAGIIAGRDAGPTPNSYTTKRFLGMAPDARIVNVKVGDRNGVVDVSQVIAAIDWVVQHKSDNGMNIRVLNLSFGTASTQSYLLDPLAFAAEQAWKRGIVVVVAAGNDGQGAALRNPAKDPFVIAVGALDTAGTRTRWDDRVASFSSCGSWSRHVDIVAPGRSIKSLRVPDSTADKAYPGARSGDRRFLGSGTSQAAAVVSGAAALLVDMHPGISPDEVKAMLMRSARSVYGASETCQGAGALDLEDAVDDRVPGWSSIQLNAPATGLGSVEAARGGSHISQGGVTLTGEIDIMGKPWAPDTWAQLSANLTSWSGGVWNGASWSGASWSGASWSGASWSGASWSGASWSEFRWMGASWSGDSWTGAGWLGLSWKVAGVL